MTQTDELRKTLDELGVEYTTVDGKYVKETCWAYMGELTATFIEYDDGTTHFQCDQRCFTPAQAIAVTVGAGTCHMEVKDNIAETEGMGEVWLECDQCHWQMPLEPTTPRFNFCPNCGRRIEVSE